MTLAFFQTLTIRFAESAQFAESALALAAVGI